MPRTPDQSASSALRTTSVYQRSKSSDILVMSFTKSCCSSTASFISIGHKFEQSRCWLRSGLGPSGAALRATPPPHRVGRQARRHLPTWWGAREARLARERSRGGHVFCRDRVDLSQQHGEQIFLGHGLVE